jgi:Flp pilus assembly protein TadG
MRALRGECGNSAVEFAFVLPLLLAAVGTVMSVGFAYLHHGLVQRAAEATAREVSIHGPDAAESTANAAAILFAPDDVTVEPAEPVVGRIFEVAVTYEWRNPVAPLLRVLTDSDGAGATIEMTRTARAVRE